MWGREEKKSSKLNNHQLHTDCYMQKRLYINLIVTIFQNPPINMQRIKRKKSKYITKEIASKSV